MYEKSPYNTTKEDAFVATLDPLDLDSPLTKDLPQANTKRDYKKVHDIASNVAIKKRVRSLSSYDAKAATRDLSMLAGSLIRAGYNVKDFRHIHDALIECSSITEEVPSDTVYSYGNRNPDGERMRVFTTHPEERIFIDSLKAGMDNIPKAIYHLSEAQKIGLEDPETAKRIADSATYFAQMLPGMAEVFRVMSPQFFTNELRPFFDPRIIGNERYIAAGGAQMPIVLLDHILWGADNADEMYAKYFEENMRYQPLALRQEGTSFKGRKSIRKMLEERLDLWPLQGESSLARDTIKGLQQLISTMLRFRKPHLKVAERNMAIRPEGSVGSGGYRTEILSYLLKETEAVQTLINRFQPQ